MLEPIKESLISVLKPFAEACFNLVNSISPAKAIVIYILVLVVVGVWVISLKQEKPKASDWPGKVLILHDLRFWACIIVALQIGLYVIFR